MATAQNVQAQGAAPAAAVAAPALPFHHPQIDPTFGFTTYITPHDTAAQFRVNLILTLQSASAQFAYQGGRIGQVEQQTTRLTRAAEGLEREVEQLKVCVNTMDERLIGMGEEVAAVEVRLASVEDKLTAVEGQLTGVESRMTKLEEKMTSMETKFVGLEVTVMDLDKSLNAKLDKMMELLSERLPAPAIEVTRPSIEGDIHLPGAPSNANSALLLVAPPLRDNVAGEESGPNTLGKRKYKSLSSLRSIFSRRS